MGIKVLVRNPVGGGDNADAASAGSAAPPPMTAGDKAAAVLLKDLHTGHADVAALADAIAADAATVLNTNLLAKKLCTCAVDKTAPHAREGAYVIINAIASAGGAACMPALEPALQACVDHLSDKVKQVAEVAKAAGLALMATLSDEAAAKMVDVLLEGLAFKSKWQTKEGCCSMLAALCKSCPDVVRARMFDLVPIVSECMNNVKAQVKVAAKEAGAAIFDLIGNRDIEQHLPLMLECVCKPASVPDVITKLSATTFVQAIETPFLTVMCPLLAKGLRDKASAIKRRSAVIIKNMAKLIVHASDAMPFLPSMMPEVTRMKEDAADPDLREQGALAWTALHKVEEAAAAEGRKSLDEAHHHADEEGEELCNCTFSLAYGGRILLNQTRMKLRRGKRYGLCGANGAGKSTLMKAINRGMVEGFPPKDVLRTVYVAHDIDSDEREDVSAVDFIHTDKEVINATAPSREAIVSLLTEYGFTETMQNGSLHSLSGGWKMKLALARAILMKADILLLDEPTNHLDTTNVKWLESFMNTTPEISFMVVSHDSGFLDNVTTDIIHYEDLKLVPYRGNLAAFVAVKPEAAAYYDLAAAATRFKFPSPGFLDGIKTRTQTIAKITDATYTYPGAATPQLKNVSLRACMASRVAVLGRNGAGKSTLIRLLTGQADPDTGEVWKHPNLRMAYVAQHAFHHVEQHLDKTPSEYIWWRYALGEDREGFETVGRKQTEEEAAQRKAAIDAGDRVVEELLQRRKHKKGLEYEVKYVNLDPRNNQWLSREVLIGMGLEKMVNNKDASIASSAVYRPLTKEGVTAHLEDFGLEAEIANNNHIRGLSGGQKVKLVLASAMWNNPHMLVLDEPTNYLDRESLGGLANAINEYEGAVLMISHNAEFTKALCTESWTVENHELTITGKPPWKKVSSRKNLETGEMEEVEEEDDGMKGLTPEEFAKQLEEKAARQAAKAAKAEARAAKIAAKQKEKFRKRY